MCYTNFISKLWEAITEKHHENLRRGVVWYHNNPHSNTSHCKYVNGGAGDSYSNISRNNQLIFSTYNQMMPTLICPKQLNDFINSW